MTQNSSASTPLWIQDREVVLEKDTGTQWRDGKPDYSETNKYQIKERITNHAEGSLNAIAHNLVKTFEMEATHKVNPSQWMSVVQDKFTMSTNGGKEYTAEDIIEEGTYNLFLKDSEHYQSSQEDFDSSYQLFHNAFPEGFHWELLEVVAPPPNVVFKWRHWGNFKGNYKDFSPTGKMIEIIGLSIASLDENLKIEKVEHYFDTGEFLQALTSHK